MDTQLSMSGGAVAANTMDSRRAALEWGKAQSSHAMESETPFSKANVVKNTALILGCMVLLATVLRSLVAGEIAWLAAGLATICAAMLFITYARVKAGTPAEIGGLAVMVIAVGIYAALSWISDGFTGSVIFAAPMLPLLASLVMNKRAARNTTVLVALLLLLILSRHLSGDMVANPDFPDEIRYSMRAVVLLLVLVGINWVVSFYDVVGQATVAPTAAAVELHDSLTGLLLRGEIDRAIAREFALARRAEDHFSFAVLELDGYDELEREYGRQGAENCLLGVADALRYCVRRRADDLGRYGAKQLCVLMTDNGTGTQRVFDKFLEMMQTLDIPVDATRNIRVTVSIGVCSERARDRWGPDDIVAGAERALQDARQVDGNSYHRTRLEADEEQ